MVAVTDMDTVVDRLVLDMEVVSVLEFMADKEDLEADMVVDKLAMVEVKIWTALPMGCQHNKIKL